jgi:hypothetical protein
LIAVKRRLLLTAKAVKPRIPLVRTACKNYRAPDICFSPESQGGLTTICCRRDLVGSIVVIHDDFDLDHSNSPTVFESGSPNQAERDFSSETALLADSATGER